MAVDVDGERIARASRADRDGTLSASADLEHRGSRGDLCGNMGDLFSSLDVPNGVSVTAAITQHPLGVFEVRYAVPRRAALLLVSKLALYSVDIWCSDDHRRCNWGVAGGGYRRAASTQLHYSRRLCFLSATRSLLRAGGIRSDLDSAMVSRYTTAGLLAIACTVLFLWLNASKGECAQTHREMYRASRRADLHRPTFSSALRDTTRCIAGKSVASRFARTYTTLPIRPGLFPKSRLCVPSFRAHKQRDCQFSRRIASTIRRCPIMSSASAKCDGQIDEVDANEDGWEYLQRAGGRSTVAPISMSSRCFGRQRTDRYWARPLRVKVATTCGNIPVFMTNMADGWDFSKAHPTDRWWPSVCFPTAAIAH